MKWILTFAVLFSNLALAQSDISGFGVGAMLGDPTALSFKGHLGNHRYFDVAMAYKNGIADGMYFHGDYLIEKPQIFKIQDGEFLDLTFGAGGRAYWADEKKHKDEFHLGLRAPVGLSYFMKDPSVEFFGELAVVFEVAPETEGDLDASIGARYWF